MFLVVRSSLVFSGLGLKPLASVFQSYSSAASRLLHPYSTDNKTSRLMVKWFSTVRDTQSGSQSYMKNRGGRREIEMSRRRKRGTQEERDRYAVICSQSVLRSPDTHRDSQNWIGKRRGKEEIEVFWGQKQSQKWERVINTLLNRNGNWILDS